jgi:exopolysaccharide biosynthesis polyprenyl glycosylphosphotransferase
VSGSEVQAAPVLDDLAASAPETAGRGFMLRRLLALFDGLSIFAALLVTGAILGVEQAPLVTWGALVMPAWIFLFKVYSLYDRDQKRISHGTFDELPWLFHAVLLGTILLWGLYAALPGIDLRFEEMLLFGLSALILISVARFLVREVSHLMLPPDRVLFAGVSPSVTVMLRKMRSHPEYGLEPIGVIDGDAGGEPTPAGLAHLGSIDQLAPVLAGNEVDRLVIAAEAIDTDRVVELARIGNQFDIKVSILPSMHDALGPSVEVDSLEGLAVLGLNPVQLSRSSRVLKRTIDFTLASAVLLLSLPFTAAIAAAIKLESRGPVLFRQYRVGQGGRRFQVLKFRTMVQDAEAQRERLMEQSKDPNWLHLEHDPRITRVGRVLRQFSLDELPQLWNVVRGDMSLVGPRPLAEDEDRRVEGWARRRLDLTPGVTGMWQVLGRTNIPFEEMVKLDYLYVTNWSLWGDLKILSQTLPVVLRRRGAN